MARPLPPRRLAVLRDDAPAAAAPPTESPAEANAAAVAVGAVATRATAAGSRLQTIATGRSSDPELRDGRRPMAPLEDPDRSSPGGRTAARTWNDEAPWVPRR